MRRSRKALVALSAAAGAGGVGASAVSAATTTASPSISAIARTQAQTAVGVRTDLERAIAQEAAEGKNVQAAQAATHDLETQITTIDRKTAGTSAALLGLTPAQWKANHGVVTPYRDDVHAAAAAARQGEADVRTALKDLQ